MSRFTWSVGSGVLLVLLVGLPGGERLAPGQRLLAQEGKLKFEIYQDNAEQYRWRLKAANGTTLAVSQGYKAKDSCKKTVESIKAGAADKMTFEVYEDNAKEHRWRLKAANGQIVGSSSEGYKAKADCDNAIAVIKKGAAAATVEEK